MQSNDFLRIGLQWLMETPVFLVCLVGIILALVKRRRMPAASLLGALGCGLAVLLNLGLTPFYILLPRFVSGSSLDLIYRVTSIVGSLAFALVLVLLVMAAFANRAAPPRANSQ